MEDLAKDKSSLYVSAKKKARKPQTKDSASGVETLKPTETMFEIMKQDFLRQHMLERVEKKKRKEGSRQSLPIKGIHTKASELRSKTVLESLQKRQADEEIESMKSKYLFNLAAKKSKEGKKAKNGFYSSNSGTPFQG